MTQFNNRYRVESARWQQWDYSAPGYYFVTMCTHNRVCFFGEINAGKMHLNEFGAIICDEWMKTFEIRPELLRDEFVVMPNHFHGIVGRVSVSAGCSGVVETPCHGVSTGKTGESPKQPVISLPEQSPKWKSGVLGAIIGQFKQQVTKRIHANGISCFKWQPRFHDRVIRNQQELQRIRRYIVNNPAQWSIDRFNNGGMDVVRKCDDNDGGGDGW